MPRPKGIPNKRSNALTLLLEKRGMNLAEHATSLYNESNDPEFRLKIITLLFPYVYAKQAEQPSEEHDVTPIEQMGLDDLKRLEISGSMGLEQIRAQIKEREQS